ncbi:HAD-IIA family hydrolase [Mesorhizobium sp.]|uniref:HAD-IIA family hydrolase n=1 Tax=Mesorhizobium sp. TaxID=1871066 RepID=UPI000FE751FC|nr:HAD-IIA family hydrolase [Mesorhizobium sp.]RWI04345.1 MAG: HAD-IIA family hydrolase [Mesorhizobium sp.]RWM87936.1 MAG: HAD-IIA family hydrolase [Mesorhizobium sp.]TJW50009.1 MAG: HAD-IIA family hydrolase [Mesorhizobium sp.]
MILAHLLDMDGVLIRSGQPIAGAVDYVAELVAKGAPFQIFTNNSRFTPEDHAVRLRAAGFPVQPEHIYTSALTTARFVELQKPRSSAYVIGDHGLVEALQPDNGIYPDFVVLGDSTSYHYEQIATGAELVAQGAWFLATNPNTTGPTERGFHPACGAVAALIEKATGRQPYFVGKPNPFMMRSALDRLGVRAADTIIVGDRMDTDVLAGLESGLKTVLVLTGITTQADIVRFRPNHVVECLANLGQITMWE